MKENKQTVIGFILILVLIVFICFFSGSVGVADTSEENKVSIDNADPVEVVKIQGENVRLADVEGFEIMTFPVARKTYQENLYVLRLHGVAHEFAYSDREEAEDMGIYICMLKGERL